MQYKEKTREINNEIEADKKITISVGAITICIIVLGIYAISGLWEEGLAWIYIPLFAITVLLYNIIKLVLLKTDVISSIILLIGKDSNLTEQVISILLFVGVACFVQFITKISALPIILTLLVYKLYPLLPGPEKTSRDYLREINDKLDRLDRN